MTQYLLDTNHASKAIVANSPLRQRMATTASGLFFLCMPVIAELWFMVENSARATDNERNLREFVSVFQVLPFDGDAAREYGRVRTELRRAGRPITQLDAQIAAIARLTDSVVLTADQHFSFVTRLRVENWLRP